MIKYVAAIILTFLVAEEAGATDCSLGELSEHPLEDLTQINGTWSDYKKTTDFLTNVTCFAYNFNCPNATNCKVDIIQKETNMGSLEVVKNDTDIIWGILHEKIYGHMDSDKKYAILWKCEDVADKETQYQLAILMKNVADQKVIKEIQDIFTKINVTYKSEPKVIDYGACNGATTSTISIAFNLILALYSLL